MSNLQYVSDEIGVAWDYENITPGDVVTGITAALLDDSVTGDPSRAALITCETNTVHFTYDGTTPTAAAGTNLGHPLAAGESIIIRGHANLTNFKCIDAVSGSAGTIKITVFR